MYRFFVENEQINEDRITIFGNDFKHIVNVLRLKQEEKIIICDRQGIDYCCIIEIINQNDVICKTISAHPSNQELDTKLYLFQGIPKQDKMELIIQKSVELGIHEIIPVQMSRSIVKINGDNEKKKLERWQKISEAAAKQSQRSTIPQITSSLSLEKAIQYAQKIEKLIVPYECANRKELGRDILLNPKRYESIGIFIGPEGGFEEQEIKLLQDHKAEIITLGKRILRTETASLVVLSNIMYNLEE